MSAGLDLIVSNTPTAPQSFDGGQALFIVDGAFNGGNVTLQALLDGYTDFLNVEDALPGPGMTSVYVPRGLVRAVLSGAPTGLKASLRLVAPDHA